MCRNNGKMNIALFAAAVLLCLTLFTTHLTTGLYARYTTEASGSDGARVARFDVKLTAVNGGSANMDGLTNEDKETDTKTYDFSITNNSEVAVGYDITIRFSNPLPDGVVPTVSLKDKENVSAKTVTGQKEFAFESDDFVFAPENQTNDHTLTITVNYYDGNNNLRNVDLSDTQVSISVTAQQID